MNLQLFANEEKTEKATPKKRRDAREEGQVIQSREVNSAFILLAAFLGLKFFGKHVMSILTRFMEYLYSDLSIIDNIYTGNNLNVGTVKTIKIFFSASAPIMLITFFMGILINYMQVGFLVTTKPLKPKLSRINPIEGFKRIFSKRSLVELLKSIVKIFIIFYVIYKNAKKNIDIILKLPEMNIQGIVRALSKLAYDIGIKVVGALIILSLFDYLYQWRDYEKNLMMTKEELKEEFKQTEGDPLIKSKIREKQRQMAMSRMMQDVPKADVIITNPTHIAVALKYDKDKYNAPYVIAKGKDLIAENIKKVGNENNIPIVENKPLAHMLCDNVEVGEIIPEELYEAVAEVLAYVYSLKERI